MSEQPTLPNRLRLSKGATDQLKLLKGRTGLTPNVLARIAIVLSIRAKHDPRHRESDMEGVEMNMLTLLGDYAQLYEMLLQNSSRAKSSKELTQALVSHIDNGLHSLRGVKNLRGLVDQLT